MSRSNLKKFIKRHIIIIIVVFMFANSSVLYLLFSKAQNANCLYQSQIDTDSRCLYIYHNEVYEKGTKNSPHQGVDCGINVDSSIPSLHFSGGILSRFNDAKIGTYCAGSPPTQAPTEAPTQQPTEVPQQPTEAPAATQAPSATNPPVVQKTATAAPKKTQAAATPTVAASVQITPEPTPVITNAPSVSEAITGNTFGEILGKPKNENVDLGTTAPIATKISQTTKEEKFNLTKISKPITYASVISFIGSIILIFLF